MVSISFVLDLPCISRTI
ncbi:hypothetical protein Godav_007100, partial [Gossypium davidsonii]|nr:hypothetical protein [Gossypium davidsonii]